VQPQASLKAGGKARKKKYGDTTKEEWFVAKYESNPNGNFVHVRTDIAFIALSF
jgi:hypothetical protein